ncbi:MAG: DUF6515 family protein [Desulfobacterales bacterium]
MKKLVSALKQCLCFLTAVAVMLFLCTGSASAFRDYRGEKSGRGDFRPGSSRSSFIREHVGKGGRNDFHPVKSRGSVIRDHQGKDGRHSFHHSPRYEPRHRPDHRPHYRPPVYNHRPAVHHHRPSVHPHRHPVRYHRSHHPRVHIGLGANFFWPWFGYYPGWGAASVFVSPPIGTVLVSLPLGCSTVSVGGTMYYYNDGVYYKEVPSGYVVAEPPAAEVPPAVAPPLSRGSYQTSVIAEVLNVRSGPGFHYPVILQVVRGDSLTVKGESEGWLYVGTPGGQFGWVVTRFTTRWNG